MLPIWFRATRHSKDSSFFLPSMVVSALALMAFAHWHSLAASTALALVMGLVGGVPPAVRAARRPVAVALREL